MWILKIPKLSSLQMFKPQDVLSCTSTPWQIAIAFLKIHDYRHSFTNEGRDQGYWWLTLQDFGRFRGKDDPYRWLLYTCRFKCSGKTWQWRALSWWIIRYTTWTCKPMFDLEKLRWCIRSSSRNQPCSLVSDLNISICVYRPSSRSWFIQ